MPCPDIQQPIAVIKPGAVYCDPVWYRFFRSPNFTMASVGGQGTGGGASSSSGGSSTILTQSTGASNVMLWLAM
jgi:hypothetical protein